MKTKLLLLISCFLLSFSINAQINWELLNPQPSQNSGKNIEFLSKDHGFIITSNELLETTDAGETWTKKTNLFNAKDFFFHGNTGIIVGSHGYVLKSDDKGNTWNQISTGFNNSYHTAKIINSNIIILSSDNSITKTTDGGSTWENYSIPNVSVIKTFFTSELIGHAVCKNGIILKTIDGGQNWTLKLSTNTVPSDFYTVYFVNENIGFASRDHYDVYRTIDGGETWTKLSSTVQLLRDFHFLDEKNGFATGDFGYTVKTTDGGVTWENIFFQDAYYDSTHMYGIYFQDNNVGYISGMRGRIMKTVDGGINWSPHAMTYQDFQQIEFVNKNIGYALSGKTFYKTTDGGDNWALVNESEPISPIGVSFTFLNENTGFGAFAGKVYKTSDGGITWNVLQNDARVIIGEVTSMFFIDENTGYVSGGGGSNIWNSRVMKTTDGGQTWTEVLSKTAFKTIQFVNEMVGYGHTSGNYKDKVYKTTDGGNTWDMIFESSGKNINALQFIDENTGYFVGDQGLMHKTTNGGESWNDLNIPYEFYEEMIFSTANIGFIVDDNGRIQKTENGGLSWNFISQQYGIKDIEIIEDKVYTAGIFGKIFRSTITYNDINIIIDDAKDITNSKAILTGSLSSNSGMISNIHFRYGKDGALTSSVDASITTVNENTSEIVSVTLENLEPNTTYYYALSGQHNGSSRYSSIRSFTTTSDYDISTNFSSSSTSSTASISGNIVSYEFDITDVVFEYGTNENELTNEIAGNPSIVAGSTSSFITAELENLEANTTYYYRIKATHKGETIYGNTSFVTTKREYDILLYNPSVSNSEVSLYGYITSYGHEITDIVFEYGTHEYENEITSDVTKVDANGYGSLSATISDLDTSLTYYYRIKAFHNGEYIYSSEGVFNFSGDIILTNTALIEQNENQLELKGLIKSYGSFLSNIHFEYGTTENFGSTIEGTPNYVYNYNTNIITAMIHDPLPDQIYYYRLAATFDGNPVYSATYQYKTSGTLSVSDLELGRNISVYPNPASEVLNVDIKKFTNTKSIEVYNTLGQLTLSKSIKGTSTTQLDISSCSKGIYFVKIILDDSRSFTSKVIIR